jgi:hypothetical protein
MFVICVGIFGVVIWKTAKMTRSVYDLQDTAARNRRKSLSLRFYGNGSLREILKVAAVISVMMGAWRLPMFVGVLYVVATPDIMDIPLAVTS